MKDPNLTASLRPSPQMANLTKDFPFKQFKLTLLKPLYNLLHIALVHSCPHHFLAISLILSCLRSILPAAVLGMPIQNSTPPLSFLCGATCSAT